MHKANGFNQHKIIEELKYSNDMTNVVNDMLEKMLGVFNRFMKLFEGTEK